MAKIKKKDNPSDRIIKESIKLFAQKGFEGVGVREIAKNANVNISMLSYYFGGKTGVLKAILNDFFEKYMAVIHASINKEQAFDSNLKTLFRKLVVLQREETDLCKVGFSEIPYHTPSIAELKLKMFKQMIESSRSLLDFFEIETGNNEKFISIMAPALFNLLFSRFMFEPIVNQIYPNEEGDSFYDDYADLMANLFIDGIKKSIDVFKSQLASK